MEDGRVQQQKETQERTEKLYWILCHKNKTSVSHFVENAGAVRNVVYRPRPWQHAFEMHRPNWKKRMGNWINGTNASFEPFYLFIILFFISDELNVILLVSSFFFRLDSNAFITIDMNGDKINNYGARIGNRLSIDTQKSNNIFNGLHSHFLVFNLINPVALSMECMDGERFMIKIQS